MFIQKWFQQSKTDKIGFEDVLYAFKNSEQYLIINTSTIFRNTVLRNHFILKQKNNL